MSGADLEGKQGEPKEQGIGFSLAALVLVAVLPLLLFGTGAAWMIVNQERAAVAAGMTSTARALQVAVDRELINQFATMNVLATDTSLDSTDLAAFQARARRVLEANPVWLNVGLIESATYRIVAGAPAVASPPPISLAPNAVDEVTRTRQPLVVGTFASSKITHGPIILLMVPVVRNDQVQHVLGVAMNPASLSKLFADQQLPATWTGAVLDARMILSGRSREPERFLGTHASKTLTSRIETAESSMFMAENLEGAPVYTVFSRSPLTRWTVAIGVPVAEVNAPIQRTLLHLALAGGALILFALMVSALVARGIMRRRNAYEAALQASEAQVQATLHEYSDLIVRIPVGVYKYRVLPDGSHRFDFVSERWCELMEVDAEAVHADIETAFARVHPEDLPGLRASIEVSAQQLSPWQQTFRRHIPGKPDIWLLGDALPERQADGSVLWHGFLSNITERKQVEDKLRVAATAFESQEGMIVTDAIGTILQVNQAFTEITGYPAAEVIGQTPSMLKSGRHDPVFYAAMWKRVERTGSWQGEIWNRRKNGEVYPEWLTITAVKAESGQVTHFVGTLTDITLRKAAEEEIQHLAFYDPLTCLPNRRLLLDRLQQALAVSARSQRAGALLFIDLDNFKILNDTLGHDVGDLLLQQVAERLSACVREVDTVARLGGDEFVVMLEDLSSTPREAATQTEVVGEKIRAALNQPYLLKGHHHHSTPSIGATLFNDHLDSLDELMKRADLAMYQAKAAGRNTIRFFDPEMQAAVTARATLEADLHQGLEHDHFILHYQPQVDDAGQLTGAEALVRWQHPQRGLISPADFIPFAEETGLILPLGNWVLETACRQLADWARQPATAHLTLAVNISARQLHHPDFVAQVLAVLEKTGANPHRLKLELTESLLLDDVEDIITKMTQLKEKGVCFSLDDFGTGYSSLSYLKRLPLDQLKIDQSFVQDILTDPNDAAIARTIVDLAHSMGLDVIAEGVETEAQRELLAHLNCHATQGYLFSRPLSQADFGRFVTHGPENPASP